MSLPYCHVAHNFNLFLVAVVATVSYKAKGVNRPWPLEKRLPQILGSHFQKQIFDKPVLFLW